MEAFSPSSASKSSPSNHADEGERTSPGRGSDTQGEADVRTAPLPYDIFTKSHSEIVIGLVGPLGTNNGKVCRMIAEILQAFNYPSEIIKISTVLIPSLTGMNFIPNDDKFLRAEKLIDLGNLIRNKSGTNSALAIAAAAEISRRRKKANVDVNNESVRPVAYIVSSLKHPDEVAELRKIYGTGFYLFAVHTDRIQRVKYLQADKGNIPSKGMLEEQAIRLIVRDEHEKETSGQHTRETFHLADFFLADEDNDDKLKKAIHRCLDLIFGNPRITPTFNEFAMFMAFTAALRSADLSRQVGAVVTKGCEILSMGANDCPCPGGGLYWPDLVGNEVDDVARGRDYKRGYDSNTIEKTKLIDEIIEHFHDEDRSQARELLEKSRIQDITEYGRVVHAEMEALLACARSNVSCIGATLYCTTFPCHNCAKHIIAAGIKRVVYVEPYPKSKAIEFHDEAVVTGEDVTNPKKVCFEPFIGVGSRQFFTLFSISAGYGRAIERKNLDGTAIAWNPANARPRLQMLTVSHREFEDEAEVYSNKLIEYLESVNQEVHNG